MLTFPFWSLETVRNWNVQWNTTLFSCSFQSSSPIAGVQIKSSLFTTWHKLLLRRQQLQKCPAALLNVFTHFLVTASYIKTITWIRKVIWRIMALRTAGDVKRPMLNKCCPSGRMSSAANKTGSEEPQLPILRPVEVPHLECCHWHWPSKVAFKLSKENVYAPSLTRICNYGSFKLFRPYISFLNAQDMPWLIGTFHESKICRIYREIIPSINSSCPWLPRSVRDRNGAKSTKISRRRGATFSKALSSFAVMLLKLRHKD